MRGLGHLLAACSVVSVASACSDRSESSRADIATIASDERASDQTGVDRSGVGHTTASRSPAQPHTDGVMSIQYTLHFAGRKNHYIDVEGVFPAGRETLDLAMAVWTPGSYLIREYSRHIVSMSAANIDGAALKLVKIAKNRWRIKSRGQPRVVVRYRLYASELSVRTNYVSDEIAIVNGAATFMTLADDLTESGRAASSGHSSAQSFEVAIDIPRDWTDCVTALDPHPDGTAHRYVAPDYDTLVDSPIVLGEAAVYPFEVDGVPHTLANFGEGGVWHGRRSADDVAAIARTQAAFWRVIPYRRYVFLNVLLGRKSGLEHAESTLILSSRWRSRQRSDYVGWLGLVSHELFHAWNVKRMRPIELGPFDYNRERYTRSLWIAEGLPAYYDNLFLHRAGLIDDREYFGLLSADIESVQSTPGRHVQSLAEGSFDAWIKSYRRDENYLNSQISYYVKGAVIGFLLDAEIRRATLGRRSLDDVMRLAYARYSGQRGYTHEQFRELAGDVAERPLDEFFARFVDSTEELDYRPALKFYGLRFASSAGSASGRDGPAPAERKKAFLGASVSTSGVVREVTSGTPAFQAGVNVGDEILAIDEYRVARGALTARLGRYRPGEEISLLVARHGKLRRLAVTLGEQSSQSWQLQPDPSASRRAEQSRKRWLAGD